MSEKILKMELVFEDGITLKQADGIAKVAQDITTKRVIQGGYKVVNPSSIYFGDSEICFSETDLEFIFN